MPAVLAVVAAFMAGIALGAWSTLRLPLINPARAYALLELLIGVWGAVTIFAIPQANELALRWIGLSPGALWHWTVAFAIPLVTLLPATAAMGATLPVMERLMTPLSARGHSIGGLYAGNTAGAALGVLMGAFIVLPSLGLKSSAFLFVGINLCCGIVAWIAGAGQEKLSPHKCGTPTIQLAQGPASGGSPRLTSSEFRIYAARVVVSRVAGPTAITLFLTGLLGIGYEVVGVRILGQILENTVYTYATVLAVFLIGTAVGGAVYHRYAERLTLPDLLSATALCCLVGVLFATQADHVYQACRSAFGDSLPGVFAAEMAVAAGMFLLPTAAMGATFSQLVRRAGDVGRALAVNTLGAACAPALFSVGLLPLVGSKGTILAISLAYLAALPTGWKRQIPNTKQQRNPNRPNDRLLGVGGLAFAASLTGLLAIALTQSFRFVDIPSDGKIVEFREGTMASVAVVEDAAGRRTLRVDNRFQMGGTGVADAEYRHAHIPLLLHPRPARALFLGLGTGITFSGAALHEGVALADGVELLAEVMEVMPAFAPFNDYPPGRLRPHVADARRFVLAAAESYDVVVGDLFHPARDGAGSLYTVEHFRAIRRKLAPGGLFCQWLPLHQLDHETLRAIVRTFLEVFPETQAWLLRFNVDAPVIGLVGFAAAVPYSAGWLEERTESTALRERLQKLALSDSLRLFGNFLAGPADLRTYAAGAPINTDDSAVILFGAPRFSYLRKTSSYGRLLPLLNLQLTSLPAPVAELGAFIEARNVFLKGLIAESEGRLEEAYAAYLQSARRCGEFTAGYARVLSVATAEAKSNPRRSRGLLEKLIDAQPDRPVARELLKRLHEGTTQR
ncbi:MAG: hypothetical protein L0Y58_05755 [Verrucomicrobia subdivision 3 bacterium]|nr:hypothetical protein [Limisphaerales bacterium]